MKHKCHKIAVLPGDGIGPEVIRAALPVFDVLDIKTNIRYGGIGWEHWCHSGNPVPPETWDLVHTSDATLLGAITSKPEREAKNDLDKRLDPDVYTYVSPVVQLRQKLNLSTNLRPVLDLWNNNFDFIVLRENTEGLYAGFDQFPPDRSIWDILSTSSNAAVSGRYGTSVTLRLQTEVALKNLLLKGFELADSRKKLLTIADKPNVLRQSSQLLRKVADSLMCDILM